MPAEAQVRRIASIAVIASVFVAAVPFFVNNRVSEGVPMLKRVADRQNAYMETLAMLRDVETGQRGFVLSGIDSFLEPYTAAVIELPSLKRELVNGSMDEAETIAVREIIGLVDAKLVNAAESIAAKRSQAAQPENLYAAAAIGKAQMDKLRILIGQQTAMMAERRNKARATLIAGSSQVAYFSAAAGLLNALLLGIAAYSVRRLIRERAIASKQLKAAVVLADMRNTLMSGAAQMLQALASTPTLDETSEVLKTCLPGLMPGASGSIYIYRDAGHLLENLASWGPDSTPGGHIAPRDCWALRLGRSHEHARESDLCCAHIDVKTDMHQMCIPMVTQGAVVGLISVQMSSSAREPAELQRELVTALAGQVSLALSNVRLREALQAQSIIDPLTDLYNRRFLEETLKRELARSSRSQTPVSIIMLDVDHFKRLNDTFGHDAGDAVLKAVAQAVKAVVRKADIVCRYGGEEFIVVLPECAAGMAMERAEAIRKAIESTHVTHGGQELPTVTASFGVATHPGCGVDEDTLVRAADAALYVAKRRGRNNVQMGGVPERTSGPLRAVAH